MDSFDVIVIGAGPGGSRCAIKLAKAGKKVALIEASQIGGTCVNRGCIPAKTMLQGAKLINEFNQAGEYGISYKDLVLDYPSLAKKREQIINSERDHLQSQLVETGVELIHDYAELVGGTKVKLCEKNMEITAKFIVLATGGRARRFPGFIEDDRRFLTSDNIFAIDNLPNSICIVGCGPVGVEFASFFRALGTKVYLVEMANNLLIRSDANLGNKLNEIFCEQGIDLHLGTYIKNIDRASQTLKLELENGTKLEADLILSAIGVEVLNDYIKTDITKDRGGRITVDAKLQTSASNIFALGDLTGRTGSAYGAMNEADFIAEQILTSTNNLPIEPRLFPDVVFCEPEVASVGYNADELKEMGRDFLTLTSTYKNNAKAKILGNTNGHAFIYIDTDTDEILGVHLIGPRATETIHMAAVWLQNKLTRAEALKSVWGHPVLAEVLRDTLES